MRRVQKGFTLVELIVVITILAILGTIAFISLQGHSRNARDSVRISDMATVHKGIGVLLVKGGIIPVPENKIEIHSGGTLVGYQGDAGENTLSAIGMIARGGKDPVDDTYYSYMTNENLTRYQLLGYLEAGTEITSQLISQTKAVEYNTKFKKVEGDTLGILTQGTTEIPIHRVGSLVTAGLLDVKTTTDTYVANFDDTVTVSGTGGQIGLVSNVLGAGGIIRDDCKGLLNDNEALKNNDGIYVINDDAPFEVYCDMTTDGGGWTLFGVIAGAPIVPPVEFFTGTGEVFTAIQPYAEKVSWSIGMNKFRLSNFELATTIQTATETQSGSAKSNYGTDLTTGIMKLPTYEYLLEDHATLTARGNLGIQHKCTFDTGFNRTLNFVDDNASNQPMQFTEVIENDHSNDVWHWNPSGSVFFRPTYNYCESGSPVYNPGSDHQMIFWIR